MTRKPLRSGPARHGIRWAFESDPGGPTRDSDSDPSLGPAVRFRKHHASEPVPGRAAQPERRASAGRGAAY